MSEIIDFLKNYYSYGCKFMQLAIFANRFVCTALADLQFKILLKIDIHVRLIKMHVLSNRFKKKILLTIANLCNLQFFGKCICAHGFN